MAALFTLPIATGGEFVCTSPAKDVYLLSFSSPPDNRLTTPFIQTWLLALDIVEHKYKNGVLVTTSAIPKFYSNGLDLQHVAETPDFWTSSMYPLFRRLLTYPMPTVALVNGHAYAAGFMTAMYHDYRVMNPAKGFVCLNEVHFGAPLAAGMTSVFRQKLSHQAFRGIVSEGRRLVSKQAFELGALDRLGDLNDTLDLIEKQNLGALSTAGAYGKIKEEMWRESLQILLSHEKNVAWTEEIGALRERESTDAEARIAKWESGSVKSKI